MTRDRALARWLLLSFLILVLAVSTFPFAFAFSTALRPRAELFHYPPTWLPDTWSWHNFVDVWSAVPLARYVRNSLVVSLGATALNVTLAVPAAYALARLDFPGKTLFRQLLLVTQMFSPVVLVIGLFRFMSRLQLVDTSSSLIITYAALSLAFSVWFLAGYFESVPVEIEEAAMIDGCSRVTALVRVVLPMSAPGLVAALVFAFIWSWNEFMIALTFISTPDKRTLPLGIYSFLGQYSVEWHYLMAAALIAGIPVLVLFLLIEKHLVKGLTAGAVK
ncbi:MULTISPECIES: carbohydrate ABC transporter permease [unclassified Nocardioides]|uniref:carbohydrate ABC transporter permease n=1 Tax=unclassified Nocardioides TaxID=2615069 RepID=UPI0000570507|nr:MULTISPECIES: carbohydrate ABC transporter permease [unclassified Nocardioides]ABL80932.1 carbohydrate ABC transporter membrane protein 2, CUT1 family [Nocardioides sp. JS614]